MRTARRRRPAHRPRRTTGVGQQLSAAAGRRIATWLAYTFAADTARPGRVPLPVYNWLAAIALSAAWWQWWRPGWRLLATVTAIWIVATGARAAAAIPAHHKALRALYREIVVPAGLPRGTAASPADPSVYVRVRRWWRGHPADYRVTVPAAAPAAAPTRRWELERVLQTVPHRHQGGDGQWWFDWPKPTVCHAVALPADDVRLVQHTRAGEITGNLAALFGADKARASAQFSHSCDVTVWDEFDGRPVIPAEIVFTFGQQDVSDPAFRDQVERGFDRRRRIRGREWLYDWGQPGRLTIRLVEQDSVEAKRKLTCRWVSDQVAAAAGRGKDAVLAAVDMWADSDTLRDDPGWRGGNGHPASPLLGDPTVPVHITVNIGTRTVTGEKGREVTDGFCSAIAARFAGTVWDASTATPEGATVVFYEGFPTTHVRALRKREERRLRAVVETQFKARGRNDGATLEVLEWEPDTAGAAQARRVRATFGAVDMSKEQTRGEFQMHLESAVGTNDWVYDWQYPLGFVDLQSVPPLPPFMPFPQPGTGEFERVNSLFLAGKIVFGPVKGGGEMVWNLNQIPHALVAGETGSGKSVALTNVVFEALYNPDQVQLWFADPKMMDWPWVREFPNVLGYSNTNEGIADVVDRFTQEMQFRQGLLAKRQCVNMGELRRKYEANPGMVDEDGPAPARQILLFDEIMDYLAKVANKDQREMQDQVKAQLESVSRLGRAMEMNMVVAAQKPDGATMGMQLREQLGFRLGMGVLGSTTSQQVFDTDHGTRWLGAAPKGRGWGGKRGSTYDQVQGFYLLPETAPAPSGTEQAGQDLPGAVDMVRARLAELGFQQIHVPGENTARWVRADRTAVA